MKARSIFIAALALATAVESQADNNRNFGVQVVEQHFNSWLDKGQLVIPDNKKITALTAELKDAGIDIVRPTPEVSMVPVGCVKKEGAKEEDAVEMCLIGFPSGQPRAAPDFSSHTLMYTLIVSPQKDLKVVKVELTEKQHLKTELAKKEQLGVLEDALQSLQKMKHEVEARGQAASDEFKARYKDLEAALKKAFSK